MISAQERSHSKRFHSSQSLFTRLRGNLGSFSVPQRRLAEYVLAQPETMARLPIAELRDELKMSSNSIMQFCHRLGFRGYSDFKVAVASQAAPVGAKPGRGVLAETLISHRRAFQETLRTTSHETLEQVRKVVAEAGRIELFATGILFPIAYLAYCGMKLLGLPVSLQTNFHSQALAARRLGPQDAAIGIAIPETCRETLQCLEMARWKGSRIIWLSYLTPRMLHPKDLVLRATQPRLPARNASPVLPLTYLLLLDVLLRALAEKNVARNRSLSIRSPNHHERKQLLPSARMMSTGENRRTLG